MTFLIFNVIIKNMKNLYLIEDDEDILELMFIILESKYNYEFTKSIKYIIDNPNVIEKADLIVTDFLSEDLTCEILINTFPHKKYLIVTAYPKDNLTISKLITNKNVKFLQKPFNISDFENYIELML